ncbi:MAG: ABC transporter permease [Lachnospiraceae bacterium]
MAVFFIYLKLELKRACKILPYFLTGAIVLALLLGTIAFSATKILYGEAAMGRVTVGVSMPDGDLLAGKVVSMLESMESVESVCDFTYVSEADGRNGLKNGELDALIVVPPMFVQGIMSGENPPALIILPEGKGLESEVFRALTQAGARTLAAAQAGIYAADDFLIRHGKEASAAQAEKELNQIFLGFALPRASYFKSSQVSAVGDVTVTQFYGASAAVLLLLLLGIPASPLLKPESRVWKQKLTSLGVKNGKASFVRICGVALLLLGVAVPVSAGLAVGGFLEFQWFWLLTVPLLCGTAAAWIVAAYQLAGSPMAGVMLLFLGTMSMVFISGGLIPAVFLPSGIQKLAVWMPTTWMMDVVKMMITGVFSWKSVGLTSLMGLAAFTTCTWGRRSHE